MTVVKDMVGADLNASGRRRLITWPFCRATWAPEAGGHDVNLSEGLGSEDERCLPQALLWSFVFCFVIMTVWAMLLVELVYPLIKALKEILKELSDSYS